MMMFSTVDSATAAIFRLTPRATAELSSKERRLSSRLRQLLLLMEKTDSASVRLRESLMTAENLDYLLRLELIEPIDLPADDRAVDQPIDVVDNSEPLPKTVDNSSHLVDNLPTYPQEVVPTTVETPDVVVQSLDWQAIQALMISSLRHSCGLLAMGLIREIEAATHADGLRRCQARWKMTILDTRFDRAQLQVWIEVVSAGLAVD